MSDLLTLIERVEKCTEGSRELDSLVGLAFAEAVFAHFGDDAKWRRQVFETNLESWVRKGSINEVAHNYRIPLYTSSLDAVVGLIEREMPGCAWAVDFNPRGRIEATVWHRNDADYGEAFVETTPPLALLLAFLRADPEKHTAGEIAATFASAREAAASGETPRATGGTK
jgi:hypothetical protein